MNNKPGKTYYSREINIGDLWIGGHHPVLVQTMTNTSISDIRSTVDQIKQVVQLGCHLVRVAVPSLKETEQLPVIKNLLKKEGVNIPLVADVHYSAAIAERSARYVEKVRINPGNFIREVLKEDYTEQDFTWAKEQIAENVKPLLKVCKTYGTALRIGVNWGSLSPRMLYRYGNTPKGMVASALEFMEILTDQGFQNLTVSLKASDVRVMQEANILLVEEMIKKGFYFPLHLGVTEAGADLPAKLKSAAGIGALLKIGIGDTIRVSLSEDPTEEIPVAQDVISFTSPKKGFIHGTRHFFFKPESLPEKWQHQKVLIANKEKPADVQLSEKLKENGNQKGTKDLNHLKISKITGKEPPDVFAIKSAVIFGHDFLTKGVNTILLDHPDISPENLYNLSEEILQALGLRYSKAEFIACPSCGRTKINVLEHLQNVKKKTAHLKGLKIAVMGCPVNGPGEMADADYGYVGTGKGKITLYKKGTPVLKNIDEKEAVEQLVQLIKKDMD